MNDMMRTSASATELDALRNLEQAVRSCGLPTIMVSGQAQLDMLSAALKAVVEARMFTSGPSTPPSVTV